MQNSPEKNFSYGVNAAVQDAVCTISSYRNYSCVIALKDFSL